MLWIMFGNVTIYWLNVLQLCRASLVKLSHSSSWHWLAVYCSVQHAHIGTHTHYVPLVSGYRSAKYWPNISQSAKVRTCIAAVAQLLSSDTKHSHYYNNVMRVSGKLHQTSPELTAVCGDNCQKTFHRQNLLSPCTSPIIFCNLTHWAHVHS